MAYFLTFIAGVFVGVVATLLTIMIKDIREG